MNFTKMATIALMVIAALNIFTGLGSILLMHHFLSGIIDLCFAVFFGYLAHTMAVRTGWPKFLANMK